LARYGRREARGKAWWKCRTDSGWCDQMEGEMNGRSRRFWYGVTYAGLALAAAALVVYVVLEVIA